MTIERYRAFIDQLCQKFSIPDPESMYDICNIVVNEVPFTILQGDDGDLDSLYIYCDFGQPPNEAKLVVLERILHTNLVTFGNSIPVFGYNSDTGNVVLMHRMVISAMEFESLVDQLNSLSHHVRNWRQLLFTVELSPEFAAQVERIMKEQQIAQ